MNRTPNEHHDRHAAGMAGNAASADVLRTWGWTPRFASDLAALEQPDWFPGRVTREDRGRYRIVSARGELAAVLTGRFRDQIESALDRPAVGDWVALSDRGNDSFIVEAVLERASRFVRQEVFRGTDAQVIAANIDFVFLVNGMDGDFNVRRLERYLTLAEESGVMPVVVLTKADLAEDPQPFVEEVRAVSPTAAVNVIGFADDDCLDPLRGYFSEGVTVALLGSSGTGKSTLINRLSGEERMLTQAVREEDSRGRHTTTHRELILLPDGGLIMDTPGMRELQLWATTDDVARAFDDLAEFATNCKFADCGHDSEPGCAVQMAIRDGELEADRLDSYRKLMREQRHFQAQQNANLARETKQERRRRARQYRKRPTKRD